MCKNTVSIYYVLGFTSTIPKRRQIPHLKSPSIAPLKLGSSAPAITLAAIHPLDRADTREQLEGRTAPKLPGWDVPVYCRRILFRKTNRITILRFRSSHPPASQIPHHRKRQRQRHHRHSRPLSRAGKFTHRPSARHLKTRRRSSPAHPPQTSHSNTGFLCSRQLPHLKFVIR